MLPDISLVDFEVLEASSLSARQRELLLGLFKANHRDALVSLTGLKVVGVSLERFSLGS